MFCLVGWGTALSFSIICISVWFCKYYTFIWITCVPSNEFGVITLFSFSFYSGTREAKSINWRRWYKRHSRVDCNLFRQLKDIEAVCWKLLSHLSCLTHKKLVSNTLVFAIWQCIVNVVSFTSLSMTKYECIRSVFRGEISLDSDSCINFRTNYTRLFCI